MRRILIAIVIVTLAAGCSSKKEETSDNSTPPSDTSSTHVKKENNIQTYEGELTYQMSDIKQDLTGDPRTVGGLTFTPAIQWKYSEGTGSHIAHYEYGPLEEDADSATLDVFFSGETGQASIDNFRERLMDQMTLPGGRDPHTGSIVYDMMVDSIKVHITSIFGTYEYANPENPRQKEYKEPYRLVGTVVEAPEGNVFFKLVGPDYTARIMIEAYMPMIKKITRVP